MALLNSNYEKKIPTSVDEAMEELDRRIRMASLGELSTRLNIRLIVREVLVDLVQGLANKSR